MNRRRFLGIAAATVPSGGCVVGYAGNDPPDRDGDHENDGGEAVAVEDPPQTIPGVELPVPREDLRTQVGRDFIPAITDPAFADDWSGLDPDDVEDPTLPDETAVIGVERGGDARAYPLRVLDWHEIVNDEFGGPIAVTYCVLCGSSVVVERRVEGEPTVFGVSGRLWRDDLVMYDEATESLWSQIFATAIRGPQTGERLGVVRSTLSSWGEWRRSHPGTDVLLPPPDSETITGRHRDSAYFNSKYSYESESQLIGFDGDGLDPRTLVVGVSNGSETRAYPFGVVSERGVVTDSVGGLPVVVTATPDGTLVAYERRLDGTERSVTAAGERYIEIDGSRFERSSGRAIDGPYEGRRLERANDDPPMFWRGWSNFNPNTTVYGE
jgi:hypothetical protein